MHFYHNFDHGKHNTNWLPIANNRPTVKDVLAYLEYDGENGHGRTYDKDMR